MAPTNLSLNFDAVLTTTMFNFRPTLVDNISTAMSYLFMLMKKQGDGYKAIEDGLGDRAEFPLMYATNNAEPYSGYDVLDTSPQDGITDAFFDWKQLATPISISRMEERKNSGKRRKLDLLKTKIKQGVLGIKEKFNRTLLQGNGITTPAQIQLPYANPNSGRTFIEPLFSLVRLNPATGVVGSIDPNVDTWWRNRTLTSTAVNYAAFLYEVDMAFNEASKGPGGGPNFWLGDQRTFQLYGAALRSQNRFTEQTKADIPFDAYTVHGKPFTWDEYMPNVAGQTTVQSATQGTMAGFNTEFLQVQYDPETNFMNTPFEKPVNQDAKVSFVMWYGAHGTQQRRKQVVLHTINTNINS